MQNENAFHELWPLFSQGLNKLNTQKVKCFENYPETIQTLITFLDQLRTYTNKSFEQTVNYLIRIHNVATPGEVADFPRIVAKLDPDEYYVQYQMELYKVNLFNLKVYVFLIKVEQ